MKNQISIFDTTLRDGEQSPGYSMTRNEKLRMAHQLEELQVDIIEAGFPIASDGDFETVKQISKEINHSTIAALCRTRTGDIDRALEAVRYAQKPRIHIFIATSDIHMKHKLKMSRQAVKESAIKAVQHANERCQEIEFSAEDASRSDPDFLAEIFTSVIDAGASIINIPDTVGYAMPWEYGQLFKYISENVPTIDQAVLSAHCHNDLGVAVANSLAAIQNGARQVECTINGIGERAGNASLEEIAMCMATRQDGFYTQTNIKTTKICPASQLLAEITGNNVQPNKAVVGRNAFSHEAGIHQHGVLNNPLTYEIMTPESVGKAGNDIVLGKHSGRFALNKELQTMGYSLAKKELNQVYIKFTKLADEQKAISRQQLSELVSRHIADNSSRQVKTAS